MTTEERRDHLRQILNRHDDMARAFTSTTNDSLTIRDATHAIREATAAMLAANRAALALFNDTGEER